MDERRHICEDEEEEDDDYDLTEAEKFRCVVCNKEFIEIENIGRWQCWQHPGVIRNDKWTCCNSPSLGQYNRMDFYSLFLSPASLGCVPCDHRCSIGIYVKSETSLVRNIIYKLLDSINLLNDRSIMGFQEQGVLIARADYKYQEKLLEIMKYHVMSLENPEFFSHFYVTGDLRNKKNVSTMLKKLPVLKPI